MQRPRIDLTRRRVLSGAAASLAAVACASVVPRALAQAVGADHGRVDPPVPIPDISMHCADGTTANLAAVVHGRVTALHLMFTGCSSVCPIQGAIFQRVQSLLTDQRERGIQLLSVAVDPVGDTPAAMRSWLQRFDAREGWSAMVPNAPDLELVLNLFGAGRNAIANHSTQVNIIDRRGELIWRSGSLPSPESIADILRKV